MTKQEFIAAIETKPNFIKWLKEPVASETFGADPNNPEVELLHGLAFVSTPDGTNRTNIFFMVDNTTGEATWQNADMLQPEENMEAKKMSALTNYLASNFVAYFVNRADLTNNWAEADVYEISGSQLVQNTIMVYKIGNNPITHKTVI